MIKKLSPTKQKFFKHKIYGFDIETANNNKDFVVACIYAEDYEVFLYSPEEVVKEISHPRYRNSFIFATNLSFDFFGSFFSQPNFFTLFRGSDLLLAKTWFHHENFYPKSKVKTKSLKSLTFLDSMNFAKLSVAKMGEIIQLSKLESPSFLGEHPKNEREWKILKDYNRRDSIITYKFMKFIINSFETIGSTFKNTLASTSMSLFKNKYLKDTYYLPREDVLLEQFESYYGGRTEALYRGHISNYFYYDFNSLYPSVMAKEKFPNPNTLRIIYRNDVRYIMEYEGVSKVDIFVFPCKYPILPHRNEDGRVIFPTGNLSGWYTHIELREAVKQGAVIKRVYKTHYYLETCEPFKSFVTDLYNKRNKYKSEGNPMEYVIKITMNSLYGKFGQKFKGRDNWIHESCIDYDDILKINGNIERKGEYFRITEDCKPASFCIPIWATYVTAYGRLKLHKAIVEHNPVYCDTDSILINHEIESSNRLGDLKLEMTIDEGIIVRPKFYALVSGDKDYVKIKGLGKRLNYLEFLGLMHNPLVEYTKFAKFKEAIRRNLIPNEIIKVHKEFSLEDEKREWNHKFNYEVLEESNPITI